MNPTDFLPTTLREVQQRGWDAPDVILFSADAYVDHPAFGAAVVGRMLEALGLRVALVPQPNWRDDLRDFKKLGRPRLFFAVSGGSMDSMVNRYTARRRTRSEDAYSPDGRTDLRPDYATTVYSRILKQLYPDAPLVIGGIEASLRRFTHYDYWQDRLLPPILEDAPADLLIYGMGEQPLRELTRRLCDGEAFDKLINIPQTACLSAVRQFSILNSQLSISLHSHESCLHSKRKFAENFKIIEQESNKQEAATLVQPVGARMLVVNPPFPPMTTEELDAAYDLPYTRQPHPKYKGKRIPAYEMIRHSVTLHRGCFGGCAFCTISAHQGKHIASRSPKSILREVKKISEMPDFKGHITDLGGPSANMYAMTGADSERCHRCARPSCIFPAVCPNLRTDHRPLLDLYRAVEALPAIKKTTIGSGIRYDLILHQHARPEWRRAAADYARALVHRHVSGRLKVAPEHTEDTVLRLMRKPSFRLFEQFNALFEQLNREAGLRQQLIPYFISCHPGCALQDMRRLAARTRNLHFRLEQVQEFTSTPMTLATAMYYTGLDPYTMKPLFAARTPTDREAQHRCFFN